MSTVAMQNGRIICQVLPLQLLPFKRQRKGLGNKVGVTILGEIALALFLIGQKWRLAPLEYHFLSRNHAVFFNAKRHLFFVITFTTFNNSIPRGTCDRWLAKPRG